MYIRSVLIGFVFCSIAIISANGQWEQIPGGLKHVSASVSYLWGTNRHDHIYVCTRPCTGRNWRRIPGGLKQVDASDEEVWGVNAADDIYKRPVDGSGGWVKVTGKLSHVSASGNGYIWGVNAKEQIFKCKKPCSGRWEIVDGTLKQIDAGPAYVYGVSCNNIYARPVDGSGSWRQIPGSLKHVTASGRDEIYGVNSDDEIYRCKKPCVGDWERIEGTLMQCDATINGLFGVQANYNIFRRPTGI